VQIRQLQHFVVLAESATLTDAADRLGISQQGLSASVARLEAELGLRLLQRPRRSVCLTSAGRCLADRAHGVLDLADAMLRDAHAAQERDRLRSAEGRRAG